MGDRGRRGDLGPGLSLLLPPQPGRHPWGGGPAVVVRRSAVAQMSDPLPASIREREGDLLWARLDRKPPRSRESLHETGRQGSGVSHAIRESPAVGSSQAHSLVACVKLLDVAEAAERLFDLRLFLR
jgi:hypothetical protein